MSIADQICVQKSALTTILRAFLTRLPLATSLPGDAARPLPYGPTMITPLVSEMTLRVSGYPVLKGCTAKTMTVTTRLRKQHHGSPTFRAWRRRPASACHTRRLRKNWKTKRRTASLLATNSNSTAILALRLYALRPAQRTPRQRLRLSVLRLAVQHPRLLHLERLQCMKSK